MDITEVLKRAWAAVEAADLPEPIQAVAFKEALRIIAGDGKSSTDAPDPASGAGGRTPSRTQPASASPDDDPEVDEGTIYARVSEHAAVDRAKLDQIVHLDDGELRLSLPGLRLGKNNADRTRAVAQVLTIVRGFGLEENETPLDAIRAECVRLKVYDRANFSTQIGKLSGYVVSGPRQNRRLRAKSQGIQAFPALVDLILGDA